MIWVRWESVNPMPLQTLCSRIDSQVNSAGDDSKSAAEKGPFSVGSLDRSDRAESPVDVYHDVAGRLEAEPKQPRLRAPRIELVRSFQNRVPEPHAFTETCQQCADLAPL